MVLALINRAAAAEISPERAESWMTSATTGIWRAAKSSNPFSTAEKHKRETTVEIAVRAATKLKADWSLAATPNRARRHVEDEGAAPVSDGPAILSARCSLSLSPAGA